MRSLPSHLHRCYFLCNIRVVSSHHVAIPLKAFVDDIRGDWFDHCIAPELFVSNAVIPYFAMHSS